MIVEAKAEAALGGSSQIIDTSPNLSRTDATSTTRPNKPTFSPLLKYFQQ
jgi:hypothetical protein